MRTLCLSLMMLLAVVARADDGWGFTYQAHLLDAEGKVIVDASGFPVSDHTVEFRIYASAWATNALWARQYDVKCDRNGLFNVFLSDNATKLPDDQGQTLQNVLRSCTQGKTHIGLTVAGGTEILPRQRICAVPYAAVATAARSLAVVNGTAKMTGGLQISGGLKTAAVEVQTSATLTAKGALNVEGAVKTEVGVDFHPVPIGGIIPWASLDAPNGGIWVRSVSSDGHWAICNGGTYNGFQTPDLQGRIPLGVSTDHALKTSGGVGTVRIVEDTLPAHDHMFLEDRYYKGLFTYLTKTGVDIKPYGYCGDIIRRGDEYLGFFVHYNADMITTWRTEWMEGKYVATSVPTGKIGRSGSHNNMPPYCAVYFIMRIK